VKRYADVKRSLVLTDFHSFPKITDYRHFPSSNGSSLAFEFLSKVSEQGPKGQKASLHCPCLPPLSFVSATAKAAVCLAVVASRSGSALHELREDHARETRWSLAQDLYLSLQIRVVGLGRREKQTAKLDQIGKTVMHEILS